jgi:hypothetical protein
MADNGAHRLLGLCPNDGENSLASELDHHWFGDMENRQIEVVHGI